MEAPHVYLDNVKMTHLDEEQTADPIPEERVAISYLGQSLPVGSVRPLPKQLFVRTP